MASSKPIYCPNFQHLLQQIKPILKQKLRVHLEERQTAVHASASSSITELNDFLHGSHIPTYSECMLRCADITRLIDELVDEWKGPIYGDRLVDSLDTSTAHNIQVVDEKKFRHRAVNWIQQSSYKISGVFFARHMLKFQQHVTEFAPATSWKFAYFCFVLHLLNAEITLHRSGRKPLIRFTTLRDSIDLHHALRRLHASLDVSELKKRIKARRSNNAEARQRRNQYNIEARALVEEFKRVCVELLATERHKMEDWQRRQLRKRKAVKSEHARLEPVERARKQQEITPQARPAGSRYHGCRGALGADYGGGYVRQYRYSPLMQCVPIAHNNANANMVCLPAIGVDMESKAGRLVESGGVRLVEPQQSCSVNNMGNNSMVWLALNANVSVKPQCSACRLQINQGDLCEKCQRTLSCINEIDDYNALLALFNRSLPYAKHLANAFLV